jgi:GR25 family glycosyltransferase involved in LPS biosynthesis/tRNA A-37 threonylcarbamoyl transferase component Bud32
MKNLKARIATGVDAKILQYEENAKTICSDKINFVDILSEHIFKKDVSQNCIMINMEKDVERYSASVNELKKISLTNFVHLKGTNGLDKVSLKSDLSFILEFLQKFNKDISSSEISIDNFSEVSDRNIYIQEGPLGCYCSHVRAMIYGYLNFDDYTLIVEDDISITNTKNISDYLKRIPEDWDIIYFNSMPKNRTYDEPYYKFIDEFHSGHFYIIKNSCLPILFKNLYPINDQVDVLISNLHKELNIYNITDTVYQKNITTNTQNNLYVIFNSPHYSVVRKALNKINDLLNFFANRIIPHNKKRNSIIVQNIIYDVLYNYIRNTSTVTDMNVDDFALDHTKYSDLNEYHELWYFVDFFLNCAKKGIQTQQISHDLIGTMLYTLEKFNLHSKYCKAYSFGATAHTYFLGKKFILKKYNEKLRWSTAGHDNSQEIFNKELEILKRLNVPQLINYSDSSITTAYCGESLYNHFKLPKNWKKQIREIFSFYDKNGIYYPEFRLQNILVLDKKITFVDFGLAQMDVNVDNSENCEKFISYLSILKKKFKVNKDLNRRHQLIFNFLKNI